MPSPAPLLGAVAVDVPFADARAADLSWSLERPELPALARVCARLAGYRVELRVLGASHQVAVAAADTGAALLTETVACLADPGRDARTLPGSVRRELPGPTGYRFRSGVERLAPDALTERVAALVAAAEARPAAVAAAFPGDPAAVTALAADSPGPGLLHWTTWHSYPQSGELVRTETHLSPPDIHGRTERP
ncbi:DUF2617 family protein [Nocardiopsis composta]|uniref:DUF2617 family protein n=1 Tax=Nocardiopsis composta TaxID=157465 RepID=A0A7W8QPW9_9ACTN|nr:DUF2617 family protein [Nocardiopsis composta]MBB5433695.1 hypothetical protein [Nocardiopsis composta]